MKDYSRSSKMYNFKKHLNKHTMKIYLIFFAMIFFLNFVSAAHYVVGYVEDALDGELANGKVVTLWNPANGQGDNVTDTIGPTGNSGQNNIYMIDCEMLTATCSVGDILSLKVFENGNQYVSNIKNVTITPGGYDAVENLTLNSPPEVNLISPENNSFKKNQITLNCSFKDLDNNLNKISLWSNFSGTWELNETKTINSGETWKTFVKNLQDSKYEYNCYVEDSFLIGNFANKNNSFTVDNLKPNITSIEINATNSCQDETIRINCSATDVNLKEILIQSISPTNNLTNYTTTLLSGNTFYRDLKLTEQGSWKFKCIAIDLANNENALNSSIFELFSSSPELILTNDNIFIDKTPSFENEIIKITAKIQNTGCGNSGNFIVSLFDENKSKGGENLLNETITIEGRNTQNVTFNWSAKIGTKNLFVYTDLTNIISEENETNNDGNLTTRLTSWQEIYGNAIIDKIIGKSRNKTLEFWKNETNLTGNIFVTDSELSIDWLNLQAIGKTKTGSPSNNDFEDIDTMLGMSSFEDSVYKTFSTNGTPKNIKNFTIFGNELLNVPVINSTDNENFLTGILWDKSDSINDEYDSSEREDLIFVTETNNQKIGKHGTYDYEIKIPVRLRNYNSTENSKVYYYYELN